MGHEQKHKERILLRRQALTCHRRAGFLLGSTYWTTRRPDTHSSPGCSSLRERGWQACDRMQRVTLVQCSCEEGQNRPCVSDHISGCRVGLRQGSFAIYTKDRSRELGHCHCLAKLPHPREGLCPWKNPTHSFPHPPENTV